MMSWHRGKCSISELLHDTCDLIELLKVRAIGEHPFPPLICGHGPARTSPLQKGFVRARHQSRSVQQSTQFVKEIPLAVTKGS
eukprot:4630172-Pyramimonas_sp.AAC.1